MEKTNDVLKFAKQGDAKAIEAIFNKHLNAKNIAVKAVVRDGCLQIMFDSKQALSQVTMVNGVKKVLTDIKPENIQTVKVYSKQLGDDFPKWHEDFELAKKKKVDVSSNIDLTQLEVLKLSEMMLSNDSNESPSQAKNSAIKSSELIDTNTKSHVNDLTNNLTSLNMADEDSLLMEKARWGYLDSISTLLNSAFNGQGISASLNKPKTKFLEIILKSNDIIDKQIAIEIICQGLNKTKTRVFNEVCIFVDTSESDFPSWKQNLIFKDNQFIEKEDVVVISPDSDVFSHLAKLVIEAKDNINNRINSKANDTIEDGIARYLKSNLRLTIVLGTGFALILMSIPYYKIRESHIESNEMLLSNVYKASSQKGKFEALDEFAKNYKKESNLFSNSIDCNKFLQEKNNQEKKVLDALTREELSTILEAERINLMPIQSDDFSYVYKSFRDLPDNYWKLATTRIFNGINCGVNNPNSFLRQYDFSNKRYQYILRADRSSEINAMVAWQLTYLPNSPIRIAVEMQTDNYTQFLSDSLISQVNNKTDNKKIPLPLSQSYATCQGTRNEMAIKQITAKQAIENNPSSNDSNELRLRYIQIICPYLFDR